MTTLYDNTDPKHTTVEFRGLTNLIDSETFETIFTDHVAYNKYFGARDQVTTPSQVQKAAFFNGCMYEFCIDNEYGDDFGPEAGDDCGTNMCSTCPVEQCLSE
ncbi:MAG: hypothetical protein V2I33_22875 [Kangiellaceae bacterium]|nr:hypothetical protein [Kangiellaceae bacterium]